MEPIDLYTELYNIHKQLGELYSLLESMDHRLLTVEEKLKKFEKVIEVLNT